MAVATRVRWWAIVLPCMVFWMVGNIDKLSISLIITNQSFLQEMGLVGKPVQIAFLFTAFTLIYAFFNLVWGVLADKLGARRVAILGVSIWGLTMILGGASVTYGWLLASRIILGAGESVLWVVSTKFSATWFPKEESGRAQSVWWVGNQLGPAIGAPIIVGTMLLLGWRAAFFVLAGISLVVVLPLFAFLSRDTPAEHRGLNDAERRYIDAGLRRDGDAGRAAGVGNVFAYWRYWVIVLGLVSFSFVFFGVAFWMPTYLEKARHFAPAAMTAWTSTSFILGTIGGLLGGYLTDRMGRGALVGGIAALCALVFLWIAAVTPVPSLAAAMLGLGLGAQQCGAVATLYLLQRYIGDQVVGRATGVMSALGSILPGQAPLIIGFFVAAGGGFTAGIIFLAACSALAAVTFFTLAVGEPSGRAAATALGA